MSLGLRQRKRKFSEIAIKANFAANPKLKRKYINELKKMMVKEKDKGEQDRMSTTIKAITTNGSNNVIHSHGIQKSI